MQASSFLCFLCYLFWCNLWFCQTVSFFFVYVNRYLSFYVFIAFVCYLILYTYVSDYYTSISNFISPKSGSHFILLLIIISTTM